MNMRSYLLQHDKDRYIWQKDITEVPYLYSGPQGQVGIIHINVHFTYSVLCSPPHLHIFRISETSMNDSHEYTLILTVVWVARRHLTVVPWVGGSIPAQTRHTWVSLLSDSSGSVLHTLPYIPTHPLRRCNRNHEPFQTKGRKCGN